MKLNVAITGAIHKEAIKLFEESSEFNCTNLIGIPRSDVLKKIQDIHIIVSRSETTIDRHLIDSAPNLKIIGRAAVGVANIDVEYATSKGILVINCPGQNTNSAAEMTMGLLLSMSRNLPQAHTHTKDKKWQRTLFMGNELRNKTIGLVGLGHVGHRVAKFCLGFDMKVLAYDPYIAPSKFEQHQVKQMKELKDLLRASDILSVHTPLNDETHGLIDEKHLALLPRGAMVLNVARGGIVDEKALLKLLESKHIDKAAIDTWSNEPNPDSKLLDLPNIWCSPHIGATTEEAQLAVGTTIFQQVEKAAKNQVVDYPINLPFIAPDSDPSLKAFAILAEKLASIAAQTNTFNPTEIELVYRGHLKQADKTLVKLGLFKGYASKCVDGYTSYVNAEQHFNRLGINFKELLDPVESSYKSAIKIILRGQSNQSFTLGGTVFNEQMTRLSLIDNFYFEVEPKGNFILLENHDTPGVVGFIGNILAKNSININSFDLSRNKKGGQAMALIRTDAIIEPAVIAQLKANPDITNIRVFSV